MENIKRKIVESLVEVLKGEKKYRVRESIVEALGRIGDKRAVPHLIEALRDKNDSVRCSAVTALGELRDKSAIPALLDILKDPALKDQEWGIRLSVVEALKKMRRDAIPALLEALKDNNSNVRKSAVETLGKLGEKIKEGGQIWRKKK